MQQQILNPTQDPVKRFKAPAPAPAPAASNPTWLLSGVLYALFAWLRPVRLTGAFSTQAAEQFSRDVALNPRDTEEAVWNMLSQARAPGGSWQGAQVLAFRDYG